MKLHYRYVIELKGDRNNLFIRVARYLRHHGWPISVLLWDGWEHVQIYIRRIYRPTWTAEEILNREG